MIGRVISLFRGAWRTTSELLIGEDTHGMDVKAFGATTGKYWLWDTSADGVVLVGTQTQTGNQVITGNLSVTGTPTFTGNPVITGATTHTGNLSVTGTVAAKGGAATAALLLALHNSGSKGLGIYVVEETKALTNAAATDLSANVPAGAVLLSVQARLDATVVGDASGDNGLTKVGIGVSGDPDLYGLSADLIKNTKINTIPDWAAGGAAIDMQIYACDNAGGAVTEKFVAGSTVTVRYTYALLVSLADAA